MSQRIEIKPGDRYGRLIIIEELPLVRKNYGKVSRNVRIVKCKCDCGNEFIINLISLRRKDCEKSCGCNKKVKCRDINIKHGKTFTRLYKIWSSMKTRCLNKEHDNFKYYGGRGIKICEEWLTFENFYNDMGNGYKINLSLDRIDSNGDYNKANCRWIEKNEQFVNRRSNRKFHYKGELLSISEISKKTNINYYQLRYRLMHGWSIEKIMNEFKDKN